MHLIGGNFPFMMDSLAFESLVRPSSPNTYLVAPEGVCASSVPDRITELMATEPAALFKLVQNIIAAEASWDISHSDAASGTIGFVATSKLMRYKDDIDILILPAEGTSTDSRLAIYSRSRVGYSDMGANRKRVLGLLDSLKSMQN